MWFEVLPPFFIMVTVMSVPQYLPGLVGYIINKNVYRRGLGNEDLKRQYVRDIRLSKGDPYILKGLESIPEK